MVQTFQIFHIDLPNSWLIGDYLSDVEAGKGAGCRTVLIDKKKSENHYLASSGTVVPDKMCSKLTSALFQVETNSTPSLNIHTVLRSGVEVKGIELWIERSIKNKRIILQ